MDMSVDVVDADSTIRKFSMTFFPVVSHNRKFCLIYIKRDIVLSVSSILKQ